MNTPEKQAPNDDRKPAVTGGVTGHFNQLTPAESELLALLAEECAEVVQVVSKIQRHGLRSRNPLVTDGPSNLDDLHRELGDVWAAVELLYAQGIVAPDELERARLSKLRRVGKWLHHSSTEGSAT